jgi:hypothetical protein
MILTAEDAENAEGTQFVSLSVSSVLSAVFFFSTAKDGSGF